MDMLVALKCEKRKRRKIGEMLFGNPKQSVGIEKIPIAGSFYYLITVRNKSGRLTEREAAYLIKNGHDCIIRVGGCEMPQGCKIDKFLPKFFWSDAVINGLATVLKKADLPPLALKAAVYDPQGNFPQAAEMLLKYCGDVKVFCENEERYVQCLHDADYLFGAMIVVTDAPEVLNGCDIVLAPEIWDLPICINGLVFAAKSDIISDRVFTPADIHIPPEISRSAPRGCDIEYFFSAYHELCSGGQKFDPLPLSFMNDGMEVTVTHVANLLKSLDKQNKNVYT